MFSISNLIILLIISIITNNNDSNKDDNTNNDDKDDDDYDDNVFLPRNMANVQIEKLALGLVTPSFT